MVLPVQFLIHRQFKFKFVELSQSKQIIFWYQTYLCFVYFPGSSSKTDHAIPLSAGELCGVNYLAHDDNNSQLMQEIECVCIKFLDLSMKK